MHGLKTLYLKTLYLKQTAFFNDGLFFATWRILTGLYVAFYTIRLWPYANDLYTRNGLIPDLAMNRTFGYFPSFFLSLDTETDVKVILGFRFIAALMLACGFFRRGAAAVIWLTMVWTLNRNTFTDSPEFAMVGWTLVASLLAPLGEPARFGRRPKVENWKFPKLLRQLGWILFGLSYTYSGYSKLSTHDWISGHALFNIFAHGDTARLWTLDFADAVPPSVFQVLTYFSLVLELIGFPAMLFAKSRPFYCSSSCFCNLESSLR